MDDAQALPDDLDKCHELLLAAFKQATELERVLDETAASYESLQAAHQAALEELSALKRWIYGRRTEKLVEGLGQGHLFDLEPTALADSEASAQDQLQHEAALPRRRRHRALDLAKLPHYRHEHDVSEADKQCSCCGRPKARIGQDESRVLEYLPAKLEVHIHVRPKYACRWCQDGVVSPPPPPRPIDRGIAGPGLVAQIVVAKFGDHLPLYRQEDFFTRHGLHIPRSTLCDSLPGSGRVVKSALRATEGTRPRVTRVLDGRYTRNRAHRRPGRQLSGPLLGIHRRPASLHGVRLHRESRPRWASELLTRTRGLPARRRLRRLRPDLSRIE